MSLYRPNDHNAHRIAWSVQQIFKLWDQLATTGGVRTTREPVQPLVVLRRPWAGVKVFNEDDKEFIVSRDERALHTFDASTTRNREKAFRVVQGLLSKVNAAFRAISEIFLEDICNPVLVLKLYTMAAKNV